MSKHKKDIMHVKERLNRFGELSFVLHCSGKDPLTRKNKVYVKTYKVPLDLKGKKEVEAFRLKCQLEWSAEVRQKSQGAILQSNSPVKFIDFARKWTEGILEHNNQAYNYYRSSVGHLKVMEEKLSSYYLHEMTQPIIQDFCKWLCNRTHIKETITVQQSLKPLIKAKSMSQRQVAESCDMANTTLIAALTVNKKISKTTATTLSKFMEVDIRKYFKIEKERVAYSYSANNGVKVMLHTVLREAVRQGLIATNYASKDYIRPIKRTEKNKKIILDSYEDIEQFVKCVETESDIRKKTAFSLLLNLGLRVSEVAGLEWSDFNFATGLVTIERNCIYVSGFGTKTKPTKTESSYRTLFIPTDLMRLLKEYKSYWGDEKINHGDLWANTDRLFCQNNGNDMAGSTIYNWLKGFVTKNGLKKVTPHGLRHTNITMQIANGVDIKTVSARAGHRDITTTLNIYTHNTHEADKQAANVINNLLYGNGN